MLVINYIYGWLLLNLCLVLHFWLIYSQSSQSILIYQTVKIYLGKSSTLNFRHPFYSWDVWNSGWEIFYARLYFLWYLSARTVNVIELNRFCYNVQKGHRFRENLVSCNSFRISYFHVCWSFVTRGCVFSAVLSNLCQKTTVLDLLLWIVKIMNNR